MPKGRSESSKFTSTKWFPGTVRDMRLYIPAQYDPQKPACVLVMQDGGGFRDTTVLDNLIAKGDIPVTIGIFITPGVVPPASPNALPRLFGYRQNRKCSKSCQDNQNTCGFQYDFHDSVILGLFRADFKGRL